MSKHDVEGPVSQQRLPCVHTTCALVSWKQQVMWSLVETKCMQGAKDGQRQGGALTIKHTAARKGKGPAGKAGPPGSDLERKVVNCLSCGKVYDFRLAGAGQLTNDLLRFLGQAAL